MNSLSNLSKKNLKMNKRKNLLAMISIILSTCLITAISILTYSMHEMNVDKVVKQVGCSHATFNHISTKDLELLKSHKNVKEIGESIPLGKYQDIRFAPNLLKLSYNDEIYAKNNNEEIIKGTFPKKENEIAMPKWMLEKMGVKDRIGEKININYSSSNKQLKSHYEGKGKFVLCGILNDSDEEKNINVAIALVSKEYILKHVKNNDIDLQADFTVKGFNIKDAIYGVAKDLGINNKNVHVNEAYLQALGVEPAIMMVSAIICIVVIASCVLVINNIFVIHIGTKIREFGLVSALGATKKQIRKLVFKEGLMLSILGIPLGIMLGHILSFSVGHLVFISNSYIKVETSIFIILIAAFISLITIILSLRKPSKIASKISPIEAIRYSGVKISSSKKKRKGEKIISLKKLAYLNLWRNKKRTIVTVISISLTGVLIILFSSMANVIDLDKLADNYVSGDIELTSVNDLGTYGDKGDDPLDKKILNNIKKIDGIEKINTFKYTSPKYADGRSCDLYGYDENSLEKCNKYMVDGKLSISDMKNKNIILVKKSLDDTNYKYNNLKVGDKVKVKVYDKTSDSDIEKELIVGGSFSKFPEKLPFRHMGPNFIVHEATFDRIINDKRIARISINIKKAKYESAEKSIKKLSSKNERISFSSKKEFKEKQEKDMLGMEITGMSLVGIIGLIGVINLVNTMITSIMSRKKELAMMQAVGLTNAQLRTVLQIEGMYYSVISLIISIIGGWSLGYLFYLATKDGNEHIIYRLPIIPMLAVSIGFIAIQYIITYIVERKLHSETVIERIRCNE
ncbi:ABC transporter permease [Clostridium estertheticum]|uniref:ABC transporter permease n=1 Tax=Clostridium estertheticum TaxID=238834 RepID=UPI001C0C98E7|nr:ABC transporter permease [Clostridium estertheticum]MBU3187371.1 ABC transporter permease [Clostridium estertheticum]